MAIKVLKVQLEVIQDDAAVDEGEFRLGTSSFVGVRARAEIEVAGTVQEIASPGLWGVDGESDNAYLRTVGEDEYAVLTDILSVMGVKKMPPFSKAKLVRR